MADTAIEWTERTWNPIVGCSLASPGCKHCYAMRMAGRLEAMGVPYYQGTTQKTPAGFVWTGKIGVNDSAMLEPLLRRKPTMWFVNSMSDLFHEDVPDDVIDQVFAVMALSPQHVFQVLTKRADRMRAYLNERGVVRRICVAAYKAHRALPCFDDGPEFSRGNSRRFNALMKRWWAHVGALTAWTVHGGCAAVQFERTEPGADYPSRLSWPLPNVWLGVSVEDQRRANERVPQLLNTPAAVRWLSCEPLLETVDLTRICLVPQVKGSPRAGIHIDALRGRYVESGQPYIGEWDINHPYPADAPPLSLNWIVGGGESGKGARPLPLPAIRSLRDQCDGAGTLFFFKQWGAYLPCGQLNANGKLWTNGSGHALFTTKGFAGRYLDGQLHNAMPAARHG